MEKKLTKREMFAEILTAYNLEPRHEELIKHEIELLEKKASKDRKPTKVQIANESLKEEILAIMSDSGMTCTEIAKLVQPNHEEPITTNKISAMMTQLIISGKVRKFTEKRKSYFVPIK